jgi:hypothetical protein
MEEQTLKDMQQLIDAVWYACEENEKTFSQVVDLFSKFLEAVKSAS